MAPKIITNCGNFTLDFNYPWFRASPLFLHTLAKWNAKFSFIWKEDSGPLSNSPVLFLLSSSKTLLMSSLVQESLDIRNATDVAPFLKTLVCDGSWFPDTSCSPQHVKLSQVLELTFKYFPFSLPAKFSFSVNSHPFQQWPSVAHPLDGGCCPLENCQVSDLPQDWGCLYISDL